MIKERKKIKNIKLKNIKLKVNYNKPMKDIYKDRCEKIVGLDLTIGEILIRNKKKV